MGTKTNDAAFDLASRLFFQRLTEISNDSIALWRNGQRANNVIVAVPSKESLNIIIAALGAATDDGLGEAMVLLNREIDSSDKLTKKRLGEIVEQLRAQKSSDYALAVKGKE